MSELAPETCRRFPGFIDRFSTPEKIIMRISFYGFIVVGAYGIFLQSLLWGLLYSLFAVAGSLLVILSCLCAHCPYPYLHDTCLFIPLPWIKGLYKHRPQKMSRVDKAGWVVMLAGLIIIPQFFLIANPLVMAVFWIVTLPMVAIPLHYCRRCRHVSCPFNQVGARQGQA